MIRYIVAAQALKFFSLSKTTRTAYRHLGNVLGARRRRVTLPAHYIARADANLRRIEAVDGIRDGLRVMELGTGWVHWEALFVRLFYDVEVITFDVWDNRQLEGLKNYAASLRTRLRAEVTRPEAQLVCAETLLDAIADCPSFEDIYALLNITYILEPSGRFDAIPTKSVDLIFSSDVLEHIPAAAIPTLMADMSRILRPGAISAHQIVPADHLVIYDRTANPKQYLSYSSKKWSFLFENEVQYFNRVQNSEWVNQFCAGGFEIVQNEILERANVTSLKIDSEFEELSDEDIACTVCSIVARRPLSQSADCR